jgi:hypothetical protein
MRVRIDKPARSIPNSVDRQESTEPHGTNQQPQPLALKGTRAPEPRAASFSERELLRNRTLQEVGYRRPPRAHRFKPGQSGNPRGRPKGAKNEATILTELLNRKIDVRRGRRMRRITILEAILLQFVEDALKGNSKSAGFLLNRYAATQGPDAQPSDDLNEGAYDAMIDFARRIIADENARNGSTP